MMTMHTECCTDELSMLSLAEATYSTGILSPLPCNLQGFVLKSPRFDEAAFATVTVPSVSKWILQASSLPDSRSHVGPVRGRAISTLSCSRPESQLGAQVRSTIELFLGTDGSWKKILRTDKGSET